MALRQSRMLAASAALAAFGLIITGKTVGIGLLAVALTLLSADRRLLRGACTLTLALMMSTFFPEGAFLWALAGALLSAVMVMVRLAPQWLLGLLLLLPAYATNAASPTILLKIVLVGLAFDVLMLIVQRRSYGYLLWPMCLVLTLGFPLLVLL